MNAVTVLVTLTMFGLTLVSPCDPSAVPPLNTVVQQEAISVAPFNSIELRNGGRVKVRYGASQRVTLVKGNAQEFKITVDGGRLVIDKVRHTERGQATEVEVVTPNLNGLAVANGGLLQSIGDFPGQASIALAVNEGGIVDARSITVQSATASVYSGGRIYVKPQTTLVASVAQGGAITYWGKPRVTSSIKRGGVVEAGAAADIDKPVSEVSVYAVQPVRPIRSGQIF
jgi:putative autotransporter adhesin-like protein